jgi:hypothetical protein
MHKGIAIAFLKAIGFCNKLKRTFFYIWCGDPNNILQPPETKMLTYLRTRN